MDVEGRPGGDAVIYVARRPFVNEGVQYLPGDVVTGVENWPRPESALRAGYIVLQEAVETKPEPVEIKPVRATRKPKE